MIIGEDMEFILCLWMNPFFCLKINSVVNDNGLWEDIDFIFFTKVEIVGIVLK